MMFKNFSKFHWCILRGFKFIKTVYKLSDNPSYIYVHVFLSNFVKCPHQSGKFKCFYLQFSLLLYMYTCISWNRLSAIIFTILAEIKNLQIQQTWIISLKSFIFHSYVCIYDFSLQQIRKRVICCNLSKSQSWPAAILTHYTVFNTQTSLTVVTPFITIHGDLLNFLLLDSK